MTLSKKRCVGEKSLLFPLLKNEIFDHISHLW